MPLIEAAELRLVLGLSSYKSDLQWIFENLEWGISNQFKEWISLYYLQKGRFLHIQTVSRYLE